MNARQMIPTQILADTGCIPSRGLIDFIDRAYGIMPDGDKIADFDWLITVRGPSIDFNRPGPLLLWCGSKSPKQFIEIPPTMTRRQFMCLCEAFGIETY